MPTTAVIQRIAQLRVSTPSTVKGSFHGPQTGTHAPSKWSLRKAMAINGPADRRGHRSRDGAAGGQHESEGPGHVDDEVHDQQGDRERVPHAIAWRM